MKTINRLIYSPYTILLIFGLFLWGLFDYASRENVLTKSFFDGNLLPELIGFGLEGLLFVGVLVAYNRIKEKDRIRAVHYRLSDTICLFAKGVTLQVKDKGLLNAENISGIFNELENRQGFAYDAVTTTLYYLHGDIPEKQESLTAEYMAGIYIPIIDHAEFSKARLDELLSLASTISIEYLDEYNALRQTLEELCLLKNEFKDNHIKSSSKAFLLVMKYNKIAEFFV